MIHRRAQTAAARCLILGIGCVALLAMAGLAVTYAATPRPEKAPNPHWRRDTCATCHEIQDGKKLPITPEKADEICLKCHDGRKAAAEFHPVGRAFDGQKYVKPEAWPLSGDRLGCLTCHEMKLACSEMPRKPSANRMMLRDYEAGRSQSQPFCQKCHHEAAYKKINPHIMLLADRDEIVEEKYLFCHDRPLDRNTKERAGKPALHTDEVSMCRDCHPQHKDPMIQGHLGLKVSEDMLAVMQAREVTGLSSAISPQLREQLKKAGGRPKKMVTGKDSVIQCSTCHNPHQYGVFPKESDLSYRAMRLLEQDEVVSPVRGQIWCRHCHEI